MLQAKAFAMTKVKSCPIYLNKIDLEKFIIHKNHTTINLSKQRLNDHRPETLINTVFPEIKKVQNRGKRVANFKKNY
ncbi:MAG TPA: hypothetical protein DDX14_08685 [Cyanobacteria bacterium UBA9579]|nr:hypothetical protein [Cyanobacteria bacterium UBA9579]